MNAGWSASQTLKPLADSSKNFSEKRDKVGKTADKMLFTSKLLILLHLLLGIGAVFGGVVLVIDPSGELINMPITLLENSPFDSFLIPGIILFVVLGVLPLIVSFALATKRQFIIANKGFRDTLLI